MSTPNAFIESLIHEWDKLINMGTLKSSKAYALDVYEKGKASWNAINNPKENERKTNLIQENELISNF